MSRRAWALPLTMAVAVALRLVWITVGSGRARFENVDTTAYRAFAAGLPGALGDPPAALLDPTLQRSPGYPLLVWALGAERGSPTLLLVVQCLLGGIVVVGLVHQLARRMAGPRVALLAAAVVAVDPVSIGHCLLIGTETLFTVALLGAVLLVWTAGERATAGRPIVARLAAAGAVLGVGTLVRPQLVYLVPVAAAGAGILVATRPRRGAGARSAPAAAAVAAVVVLLAATVVGGPWLVRNRVVAGRWVVSTAQSQNLADIGAGCMEAERSGVAWWPEAEADSFARHDRARARFEDRYGRAVELGDVVARDAAWARAGRRAIADHPRGCTLVLGSSLLRAAVGPGDTLLVQVAGPDAPSGLRTAVRVASVAVLLAQIGLAAAGLVALARRRWWAVLATLLLPVTAYLLSSAGPQLYARFRVPVVPYLAVLAAIGAVALWDRASVSRRR